jgi:hypothetical protein
MMTIKLFCASLFVLAVLASGFWDSATGIEQPAGAPARASAR